MKEKLNLTIDSDLIPKSKEFARANGLSLSQLVEELLRQATIEHSTTFASKWRGKFRAEKKDEPRYSVLEKRYLT